MRTARFGRGGMRLRRSTSKGSIHRYGTVRSHEQIVHCAGKDRAEPEADEVQDQQQERRGERAFAQTDNVAPSAALKERRAVSHH